MTVAELIPVIQMAIGPVILISGVGLLILSMTNRLGRVIDRTRELCDRKEEDGCTDGVITDQLTILMRRARLIRLSIILVSMSALAAARAYGPPEPIAAALSSGSMTSPVPDIMNV